MFRLAKLIKALSVCAVSSLLLGTNANAQQCEININYGVIIDPERIRFLDNDITFVQINGQDQLFFQGREIALNAAQQAIIKQYTQEIRQQFPEIVSMAIEGVEVGLKAVNKVIASVTGENSASHQKLQRKFDELKWHIRKRFNQSADNYYIAPQDFDEFDQIFVGQFEQEIEAIVTESIGTILMAVGEAITNQEEANSEQGSSFSQRMEAMGSELELEMSSKVSALESKAAMFCTKLQQLDKLEQQLIEQTPALSQFNLISSNHD